MDSMIFGDVEVLRVPEWHGQVRTIADIVPDSPPELRQANESWLAPDFWRPADDAYLAAVQTWVLRSAGRTILVDTGVGNDRDRPQTPEFSGLRIDFPARLAAVGVRPEDVDLVINTHVHADHVGWNTHRVDDEWVPMFPRATYLMPQADQAFFAPDAVARRPVPRSLREHHRQAGNLRMYADSIEPVLRAGQARLWSGHHRVDDNLTLVAAPGHTPGSSVLRLASGSDRAVFVGDLVHSPLQLLAPEHNSCFCEDPERARATRRAVLARAADERELVFPAHFPGAGGARIRRDGDRFAIAEWAAFAAEQLSTSD